MFRMNGFFCISKGFECFIFLSNLCVNVIIVVLSVTKQTRRILIKMYLIGAIYNVILLLQINVMMDSLYFHCVQSLAWLL